MDNCFIVLLGEETALNVPKLFEDCELLNICPVVVSAPQILFEFSKFIKFPDTVVVKVAVVQLVPSVENLAFVIIQLL